MHSECRELTASVRSRLRVLIAALAMAAGLCAMGCSRPAPERARVYPDAAAELQPIRLPDLIYNLLPDNGSRGWDWDSIKDPHLKWLVSGLQYTPGETRRDAMARVRLKDDQTSSVLKDKWVESAWTVSLGTKANPGLGPETITFLPGAPDDECRGAGYKGCTYSLSEVEDTKKYQVSQKCQIGEPSRQSVVLMLVAPGKQLTYLSYLTDGGSGGDSTTVELSDIEPQCVAL